MSRRGYQIHVNMGTHYVYIFIENCNAVMHVTPQGEPWYDVVPQV